jgi:hypothetical protein
MAIQTDAASTAATAAEPASSRAADSDGLLEIYLSDHRAGAAAGQARAKRFADANANSFLAETAAAVCAAIEDDVQTFDEIARRLGCRPRRWKLFVARAGEFVGRLKTNGRLRGYSPLSRLEELELLVAGILSKESLWRTLGVVQRGRPELAGFDFDDLQQRAMEQRMRLESHRATTVEAALLP